MTKAELIAFMVALGWELDRFGHLQKDVAVFDRATREPKGSRRYRIKLQATSCHIEVKGTEKNFDGGFDWIRAGGDYYSRVMQLNDGRIRIGSTFFGVKKS